MEQGYGSFGLDGIERRSGFDRREYSLTTLIRSLSGRRALGRRADDHIGAYIDRFELRTVLLSLMIVTLCCTDAIFTLHLINSGASYELNPFMSWCMDRCVYFFLSIKLGLTTIALFVLLGLKNFYVFDRFKVSHILYGVLASYALLIKYELFLHLV